MSSDFPLLFYSRLSSAITVHHCLPSVLATASVLFVSCSSPFVSCSSPFVIPVLLPLFPVLPPLFPVLPPLFPVLLPLLFCFRLSSAISYCLGSFGFSSCFCSSLDIP